MESGARGATRSEKSEEEERSEHAPVVAARYPAWVQNQRFGSLDGLRGLAVMAVVWHHTHRGVEGWAASQRGYLGVDLFFVLSGFLITTLLLREQRSGGIRLGAFYARRSLRIFPLYYAVIGGLAVLLHFRSDLEMAEPFFGDLPYLATYTSNWIQGDTFLVIAWSLAAEEQFYLLWPPLLALLGAGAFRIAGSVLLIGALVFAGVFDNALANLFGPEFRRLDMIQATFNPIVLGVLAAAWHAKKSRFSQRSAPLFMLALVLALASWPGPEPMGAARGLVQVAMAGLVLSCVARENHALAPVLRWKPLARLGVVSYGIYLLHMFLRIWLGQWLEAGMDLFLLTMFGAWLVAEVSYLCLERPFLRMQERFRS